MHIDATKRLVRGKKISIEGGESRWVSFKFERLPNFRYKCGLLNHALKDCTKGYEPNKDKEANILQYGAWLRGDPIRRNGFKMFKSRVKTDAEGSSEKTEDRTVRPLTMSQIPMKDTRVGRDHRFEKKILKDSVPMQRGDGTISHTPLLEDLYKKHSLKKWVGKIGERKLLWEARTKYRLLTKLNH